MSDSSYLEDFQKQIDVSFTNPLLLLQAVTHRSFLNESSDKTFEHNERLEFLGDAVLELVVTDYLYRNFSNPEGELTNWRSAIVRGEVLAKVAIDLQLGQLLRLSKGEEKSGGRSRNLILANTVEAVIGAIYLDKGYDTASKFIHEHIISLLPEIIEKKLYIDPKSHLQELSQEALSVTPEYKVIKDEGPDHNKVFTVGVYARGRLIAEGAGSSKQRAEQVAADNALSCWQEFVAKK